jgi:hypothetical protein
VSKNNQPLVSIHSSSRGQSKTFFYEDHFIFQLENDRTPRILYFNEIDTIALKKLGWMWKIWLVFTMIFMAASVYLYINNEANIYILINAVIMVLMMIYNFKTGYRKLIQLKKGGLNIDIFRSTAPNEIEKGLKYFKSNP